VTGALVLQVVLGLVVVAMAIWILGPTVGFLWKGRQLDVEVYPDAMLAKPYPEDTDGMRRYDELLALGYRPVGSTWEHARFFSPIHWRWRSLQGQRWLVAPDARTFVELHRLTEDEPVRLSAVTLFEGGGSWQTACPGVPGDLPQVRSRGHASVRGVGPAGLLDKHVELVEAFRSKHGLTIQAATLHEVAAANLAFERAVLPKMGTANMMALPLGTFGMGLAAGLWTFTHGGASARLVGLGMIVFMGLFYAAIRYGVLEMARRHGARHMHTRAFDLEQTAVTPDGRIVAGRYERWVRVVAGVAAADMVVRVAIIAAKAPAIRMGEGRIFMAVMLAVLSVLNTRDLIARARGRTPGKATRKKKDVWFNWALIGLLYVGSPLSGIAASHFVWFGAVVALALCGWQLERQGRT
jgi:hypothetical protein